MRDAYPRRLCSRAIIGFVLGKFWRKRSPRGGVSILADDRERRLLARAFRELAGTGNGVIYDLPNALRPERIPGSVFLRGSPAWRTYLDAREQADTGQPAILFAARAMENEERSLVVDWGTSYPNTFFLLEPRDGETDLTDSDNDAARRMKQAVDATLPVMHGESSQADGWTRDTPLGELLRDLFGTWVYWSGPEPYGQIEEVPLVLHGPEETIWGELLAEVERRFPQQMFDRALAYVNDWERELLGGPVPRARSVFRTRLGMPIVSDPRCVDRALRRLVNEGRISVVGATLPGRPVFGQGRPVPDEVSDEEFTRFEMR
jgi:hypothetical protein